MNPNLEIEIRDIRCEIIDNQIAISHLCKQLEEKMKQCKKEFYTIEQIANLTGYSKFIVKRIVNS